MGGSPGQQGALQAAQAAAAVAAAAVVRQQLPDSGRRTGQVSEKCTEGEQLKSGLMLIKSCMHLYSHQDL